MHLLTALQVLIVAGGLDPSQNHHSHLVHVQRLQALLADRGVPEAAVTVVWADGRDPGPDRAVASTPPPEHHWLIAGLRSTAEVAWRPAQEPTEWPEAVDVRPATRASLKAYFAEVGPRLRAGDTLLVAVTDHGSADAEGVSHIELWNKETWNPSQLLENLAPVSTDVRVVLWMSQCHSGGFAELFRGRPNLCGTFSTSADRVAYGCYPDLAAREEVGHFQRMVEALGRHGALAPATDEVMVTDNTPDVPHLTSDALLFGALNAEVEEAQADLPAYLDARLPLERDDGLRARIALRYGLGALRDYQATAAVLDELGYQAHAVGSFKEAWDRTLDGARERLLAPVLATVTPAKSPAERAATRERLLAAAATAYGQLPAPERARLDALRSRSQAADALLDRIELQEAAALRVAWLFGRAVGPSLLDEAEQQQWKALQACESTPLFAPRAESPPPLVGAVPPVTRVAVDAEALRPGHLGLAFRELPGFVGVEVQRYLPGSLLYATDLKIGDVLTAVNGEPVREQGGFRERVMLTPPGEPMRLTGRRGEAPLEVVLPSPPFPVPSPEPRVGEVVGDLRLRPLEGALPPIGEGQPTVLLFWATWCQPCKASLPALEAWADDHGVRVVAITGEAPEVVRDFLKKFKHFPFPIAIDAEDEAHRLLGVRAQPVFVLLDGQRRLKQIAVGFTGQIPLDPPAG